MSRLSRAKKPDKHQQVAAGKNATGRGGSSVAKEDVNVEVSGKRPQQVPPQDMKPRKKAGKRLMDYMG